MQQKAEIMVICAARAGSFAEKLFKAVFKRWQISFLHCSNLYSAAALILKNADKKIILTADSFLLSADNQSFMDICRMHPFCKILWLYGRGVSADVVNALKKVNSQAVQAGIDFEENLSELFYSICSQQFSLDSKASREELRFGGLLNEQNNSTESILSSGEMDALMNS